MKVADAMMITASGQRFDVCARLARGLVLPSCSMAASLSGRLGFRGIQNANCKIEYEGTLLVARMHRLMKWKP